MEEEINDLKIFISHSNADVDLVEKLISLLRIALNLKPSNIRCTSVDGYRLPIGVDTDDTIRNEAIQSPVFLGVLSKNSFHSAYVLFELGARWGVGKKIMPLLSHGFDPSAIKGPILGKNALSLCKSAQLHQLLQDVAKELDIKLENASAYQNLIDEISNFEVVNEDVVDINHNSNRQLNKVEEQILIILAQLEEAGGDSIPDKEIASRMNESVVSIKHYTEILSKEEYIYMDYRMNDQNIYCSLYRRGREYLVKKGLI